MAKGKYARKRALQKLRSYPIESTGLSNRVLKALKTAGMENLADLTLCSEEKLRSIPGIGEKALDEIRSVIGQKL